MDQNSVCGRSTAVRPTKVMPPSVDLVTTTLLARWL